MSFNMMELMNNVSQGELPPPQIIMLPLEDIIANPANFYGMAEIDRLADSILMAGKVLQNITVKPPNEAGKYMLISGHRRRLACMNLVNAGHREFAKIPAVIETETDADLQELMLIYTNSTTRELTDAEKMHQAQRATQILNTMKYRGEFSGRVRETVAKMLKTTETQLARYASIAGNLKNEAAQKAFEEGQLGVSAAYEASRLSAKGQEQVGEKLSAGESVSVQDVKDIKEAEDQAEEEKKVNLFEEEKPAVGSEWEERRKKPDTPAGCRKYALGIAWQALRMAYGKERKLYEGNEKSGNLFNSSRNNAAMMYLQGLIMNIDDEIEKLTQTGEGQ